jgi:hypothetical protein
LLAGLVIRCYIADPDSSAVVKQLEASAYGLLVPLLCLAGIYLIRGVPQLLTYGSTLPDPWERFRFSLLVSQSLNLPIVVAYLEVEAGLMSPQVEAALVGGSKLSVGAAASGTGSRHEAKPASIQIGVTGFEPATSCSQSRRATKLRYTPLHGA